MSLNITQNVIFQKVSYPSGIKIYRSRGISILADGGSCLVASLTPDGDTSTSFDLPDSKSVEITADGGNLLNDFFISPNAGDCYVTMLNGSFEILE